MQIFELHFNPKKENYYCNTFSYKPQNPYQTKLGRVYLLGEIEGDSKKGKEFLEKIFQTLKENIYGDQHNSLEKALQKGLLEINELIEENNEKEKLSVAIIASKNFSIYLSKIGKIEVILSNKGKTTNITKDIEGGEDVFFQNIVAEKMNKNDKVIILTSQIYSFFKAHSIIEEISSAKNLNKNFTEKVSTLQNEKSPQLSGASLIIDYTFSIKEGEKTLINTAEKKKFSFKKILLENLSPLLNKREKAKTLKETEINKEKLTTKQKPTFSPKKIIPAINIKNIVAIHRKPVVLIILLVVVIIIGSIVIAIERSANANKQLKEIVALENKISQAKEDNDFLKIKSYLEDINDVKKRTLHQEKINHLLEETKDHLLYLSLSENLDEVEIIKEIESINPNKIATSNNNLYLTSTRSLSYAQVSLATNEKEIKELNAEERISLTTPSSSGTIMFSPPSNILRIQNNHITRQNITQPQSGSSFIAISSFLDRPYFLTERGEIVVYTSNNPTNWINRDDELAENGISLTVDGSIYALTKDGKIIHYYGGDKRDEFVVAVFPKLTQPQKILTTPTSPLYIIDNKAGRIITINKEGELVKQIFHESFNDIKDATISSDGKKIYLLINKEVYLLEL